MEGYRRVMMMMVMIVLKYFPAIRGVVYSLQELYYLLGKYTSHLTPHVSLLQLNTEFGGFLFWVVTFGRVNSNACFT
ncbi:hypothetical protein BZA77DRAFT_326687 [Pyronema omphalodes]|nr:hypothetical protein BZA77DRAFT_326687 [Pyronema omphalodes]